MSIIKECDIFGKEFKFNVENEGPLKTYIGGISTLLFAIGTIICIWYFGQDVYLKQSPFYVSETIYFDTSPYIEFKNFEPSKFIFFYQIYNFDATEAGEDPHRFFTPVVKYNQYSYNATDNTWNDDYKYIKAEICNISMIEPTSIYIEEIYYCFILNETLGTRRFNERTSSLYNEFNETDNFRSYVDMSNWAQLNLYRCNDPIVAEENINNTNCPSNAEYDSFTKLYGDLTMYYIMTNTVFNPKNFNKPYRTFYRYSNNKLVDVNSKYSNELYFSVAEIKTDKGFIFEDLEQKYFLEFDMSYEDRVLREKGRANFDFNISINISNKYLLNSRKYIKTQELIAEVGGFMSLILNGFTLIYAFYIENWYKVFMIEKIFNLNIIENNENNYIDMNKIELINVHNEQKMEEKILNIDNRVKGESEVKGDKGDNAESGDNQFKHPQDAKRQSYIGNIDNIGTINLF